jgi:2-keto-3-deoxy-galactonokinase
MQTQPLSISGTMQPFTHVAHLHRAHIIFIPTTHCKFAAGLLDEIHHHGLDTLTLGPLHRIL